MVISFLVIYYKFTMTWFEKCQKIFDNKPTEEDEESESDQS